MLAPHRVVFGAMSRPDFRPDEGREADRHFIALNMRFDVPSLKGEKAHAVMTALVEGYFSSGGMEVQLNVLDPAVLKDARDNPGKHPGIVVRVAGYCAYFDDLPKSVKNEIIERTRIELP